VNCTFSSSNIEGGELSTPNDGTPPSMLVDCTNQGFRGDDDVAYDEGQINFAAQISVDSSNSGK